MIIGGVVVGEPGESRASERARSDVLGAVVSTRPQVTMSGTPSRTPPPPGVISSHPPVRVTPPGTPTGPWSTAIPRGAQRIAGLVVLAALLLGGAWFGWRAWWGVPVDLAVDGEPIRNGEQVLAQANSSFTELVATDGAKVPDGAGCWFAPAAPDAFGDQPRVACGPVVLGVSGESDRWVVGTVSYSRISYTGTATGVNGTFGDFSGTADLTSRLLRRPGGGGPPSGEPTLGADGVRLDDGRTLTGIQPMLAAADGAFRAAAEQGGAATGSESRCYLGLQRQTRFGVPIRVSDRRVWCGPALVTDSEPGATWVSFTLSTQRGDTIADALAAEPYTTRIDSTRTLDAGLTTYRPDGLKPPAGTGGLEVPDAGPVDPNTVTVLDAFPAETDSSGLTAPDDGRLITPNLNLRLTGSGRFPSIGRGAQAVVAPAGQQLVVARFEITRPEGAAYGNGTATLIVDGTRYEVRDWSSVRDAGVLAAAVPAGAQDVVLEVVSRERAQTISLLTGARGPGAPAVLYRPVTRLSPAAPITVTVPLPAGDPLTLTARVSEIRWYAWTSRDGWAPPGQAHLSVTVDDWTLDRPCCDVSGIEVATNWQVLAPDGTVITDADPTTSASSTPNPRFVIPEGLVQGQVQLQVSVTYQRDGTPGTATARPALVPFAVEP